ncbi:hypothetical protein [Alkalicoccus daliensis]|uniref:Uncharacterized protein n=1 Tax=Alkalicoccus daliensis TaxID=745820 RepID=A0A1H0F2X3_9BACI|nr:hypothetical protein [Alkalicoccus daliensis]SDN89018.1 hypothetical protein SAMN04488053_104169 [Alkalicoccus daliensis]
MRYRIVEVDEDGKELRQEENAQLNSIPGTGDLIAGEGNDGQAYIVDAVVHHNFIVEPELHSVTIKIRKIDNDEAKRV